MTPARDEATTKAASTKKAPAAATQPAAGSPKSSVDGKKRRAIADTEAKAKQRLRQMQSQIEHGTRITDGNLTVQQVLDQWTAKALPNRNLQQPTLEVHRWAREILIDEIGGKRARNLLPDDVEAAFQRRADAGLSRNSLIKLRSTLSQALAWAQRRGLVASNVAEIVELPATARRPTTRPIDDRRPSPGLPAQRPEAPGSKRCG